MKELSLMLSAHPFVQYPCTEILILQFPDAESRQSGKYFQIIPVTDASGYKITYTFQEAFDISRLSLLEADS